MRQHSRSVDAFWALIDFCRANKVIWRRCFSGVFALASVCCSLNSSLWVIYQPITLGFVPSTHTQSLLPAVFQGCKRTCGDALVAGALKEWEQARACLTADGQTQRLHTHANICTHAHTHRPSQGQQKKCHKWKTSLAKNSS